MNVVTGVFVESVVENARKEKDLILINNVRELFQSQLDKPQMQEAFKAINVDCSEARGLFRLLDLDGSGGVNAEEFLSGCLRLRGPAKALDMALLIREVRLMEKKTAKIFSVVNPRVNASGPDRLSR